MIVADALRALIDESPYNKTQVGEMSGLGPQGLANTLRTPEGRGITTTKLLKVMGVLGYRVVLVPAGAKLPQGSVVVDG